MYSVEKKLGSLTDIFAGITGFGKAGSYSYRVVQPNSFSDIGTMDALEVQSREDRISSELLLQPGDILVKRLNPSFVYIVTDDEIGTVASQNLLVVRPGPEVDPQYLGFLLEQKEIIGQIEHVSGTSVAIKAISQKKLAEITIPVIPLEDQRKLGRVWQLSRKRKVLLQAYVVENEKLVSMVASRLLTGGRGK